VASTFVTALIPLGQSAAKALVDIITRAIVDNSNQLKVIRLFFIKLKLRQDFYSSIAHHKINISHDMAYKNKIVKYSYA
jgi:imidazoleglycerol phosphate dehydratase HisB